MGMDIKVFAKLVNVSEATVSRAFSGKGKVKDSTRQRIFKKALEVGYRPNGKLATNNIPFADETIIFLHFTQSGLNMDYMFNDFFKGIESVIAHTSYSITPHVIIENTPSFRDFYYDIFRAANIKGIIAYSETNCYSELKDKLIYWGKPFLLIGSNNPDGFSCIGFDAYDGARKVGAYFKANKRQKAACIVGNYYYDVLEEEIESKSISPKRQGFLDGFEKEYNDICWVPGGCTFDDGYKAFGLMQKMAPDVDCVFCENDILAIGFLRAAVAKKINIPNELAVIGFDNVEIGNFVTPTLSTVEFPKYQIGQAAANGIIDMIKQKKEQINLNMACNLVIRDSA